MCPSEVGTLGWNNDFRYSHYAVNRYLTGMSNRPDNYPGHKTSSVKIASKAIFATDSSFTLVTALGWYAQSSFRHGSGDSRPRSVPGTINDQTLIPQASGRSNVLYFDGHVESLNIMEMMVPADNLNMMKTSHLKQGFSN